MSCRQWRPRGHTVTPHFTSSHHSSLWGRKDAVGKKNNLRLTSGPSASLGETIDCVHITLWTLSEAQRAPIDLLAQSSYGPWSTSEVPTDPPSFNLCHQFVLDKLSHCSGMIIFCCGINPGNYGYGNVDWSQNLCAISSFETVSLPVWRPCQGKRECWVSHGYTASCMHYNKV